MKKMTIENWNFPSYFFHLTIFCYFHEIKIQSWKSEFRHFICIMNIAVKITVVEKVKLYRKFWISRSRSYTGGELWKSWWLKIGISRFLPFDDFLWSVFLIWLEKYDFMKNRHVFVGDIKIPRLLWNSWAIMKFLGEHKITRQA